MPRINQLPVASSVAQTDVLAIDTPEKTYQVPRSVLAPAPYIATIPTGQWSGSGSDYYITVTASNVTADAMLYPFYDNASAALLNGPVWVIPAAGSFTIHTSAIPSGTVTISVLLAGIVGEAQYQVLADVYSTSQVDSKIAQSTAYQVGDVFGSRAWRAMGRVINSGKGIYCWFSMGKPVNASNMTLNIGSLSIFGLAINPTIAGTISNVAIVGNIIMFVLNTTTTHTPGEICLIEFANTSMTLT